MAKAKLVVPEYHAVARITSKELASWLDERANRWWTADGEISLMETISFPCPGDELAEAIRKLGERQVEILQDIEAPVTLIDIGATEFEDYANTDNRYDARNFLLRWQSAKRPWLLSEDVRASESSDDETNAVD